MPRTMYCLTDAGGHVYTKDGADSYRDVATEFGLDEQACRQYRWDLTSRRRLVDRELPANANRPSLAPIEGSRELVDTSSHDSSRGTFLACSRNKCEADW